MKRAENRTNCGRFTLQDLQLTATERATVRAFVRSWIDHSRPVLFAGAGLSRFNARAKSSAPPGARMGDWAGLIEALRRRLSGGSPALEAMLPTDYLRVAQLHETQFQRSGLLDAVEEVLDARHFLPGGAHERLRRFPWEA